MKCDVAIIGDFRFPGGTSSSIAHEIRALRQGALQRPGSCRTRAILKRDRPIHPLIQAAMIAAMRGSDRRQRHRGAPGCSRTRKSSRSCRCGRRGCRSARLLIVHHPTLDAAVRAWYDSAAVRTSAGLIGGGGLRY